ncbi:3-hydroxyacyl-CoA dehydrogenase [Calidifontibacter sp. DB0510]|uniref:3-hydroxyacyl-CoA dehydrogenase n=1 Tax=Metallococcus carri TaxID=1656884 RepID=A0A967AX13_9MICO|nr:Rv3235 family protein [Metallococcus carri]NHN54546.1 3-hydroxyacyl-CoA dehydrogenase [Metallococcus carri]NOP36615.1 3-hydroxyacyl-CoA dehydrogenase [Calidifontibacter sp. DB2511S]
MSAQPIAALPLPTLRSAPALRPAPDPDALRRRDRPGPGQAVLAVDFRGEAEDKLFGPQATATADLPDPAIWAHRLVLGVLECFAGVRSPAQLSRWVTLELRERIQRGHAAAVRRGARPLHPPKIRRLRVTEPADGVAEVTVVAISHGRPHAIAMRMSGVDGRWLVTALELG